MRAPDPPLRVVSGQPECRGDWFRETTRVGRGARPARRVRSVKHLFAWLTLAGTLCCCLPAAADGTALGGGAIGGTVLSMVQAFGPPDLVETSDAGHEWRWYDAKGLDRDVLVDDALAIKELSLIHI